MTTFTSLGTRWVHKARGTTYRITGFARLHSKTLGIPDVAIVTYQSEADQRMWARPWEEFLDGRYEKLTADPTWQDRLQEEINWHRRQHSQHVEAAHDIARDCADRDNHEVAMHLLEASHHLTTVDRLKVLLRATG